MRFVIALGIQNPVTNTTLDDTGIIYCDDQLDVAPLRILNTIGPQSTHLIRVALGDDAVNEYKDTIARKATTLGVLSDFENKIAAPGWRADM